MYIYKEYFSNIPHYKVLFAEMFTFILFFTISQQYMNLFFYYKGYVKYLLIEKLEILRNKKNFW